MANPKSKVLPQIVQIYLFVMITFCFDVFYNNFRGDTTVLGTNLYGFVMGLMCIGVVCVAKKKDIRAYGATLKPKRIFKGFYRGALFSLVPIAIVAGFSFLIYAAFDVEWAKVEFLPPNHFPAANLGTLRATVIYAFALIFSVFTKEFFFRGYVIRTARSVYQFFDANTIQIILYIPIQLIIHARNVFFHLYNEEIRVPSLMISIAVFWLVHEALGAFKWGLLARAGRDIWAPFFDHYFYDLIAYSLFFSQTKITSYSTMVKLLICQILSLIMVWFFYKKKRAEAEQKKLHHELKRIEHQQRRFAGTEDTTRSNKINEKHATSNEKIIENYSKGSVQQRIDDYSNSKLLKHRHLYRGPKDYKDEKLMDLQDVNVDNFYVEYAKEIERSHQSKRDKAAKKLESSENKQK